jgi:hypothetical protein
MSPDLFVIYPPVRSAIALSLPLRRRRRCEKRVDPLDDDIVACRLWTSSRTGRWAHYLLPSAEAAFILPCRANADRLPQCVRRSTALMEDELPRKFAIRPVGHRGHAVDNVALAPYRPEDQLGRPSRGVHMRMRPAQRSIPSDVRPRHETVFRTHDICRATGDTHRIRST